MGSEATPRCCALCGPGRELGVSIQCCPSEQMWTWRGSCIPFVRKHSAREHLGVEKAQPGLPLENPQGWDLYMCPFLPRERPEGEGLCLGVAWGCGSSSWLCPGLCGHLPGFLSFTAGRAGSWPCSLRELGSSTPLSGLGAGGVRGAAACAQSWRSQCSVGM